MINPERNDSNTTFQNLKETVEAFCQERNWQNNDPKQLLLSAFIELAELAEYYQWSPDGQWQEEKQKQIAFELVDVFFYLLRFINKSEIDFSQAFFEKVEKLSKKYPATDIQNGTFEYQKVRDDYRKSGKNVLYE